MSLSPSLPSNLFGRLPGFLWIFLFPFLGHGQNPIPGWAVKAGGTAGDFSRAIAADAEGNCYVTGSFSDTAAFGGTNLTSRGGYDIFVAKYDKWGAPIWVRQAGADSASIEEGRGVALDTKGDLYVTGGFAGSASFGATNLVSSGGLDVFLAKYTALGELLWVRSAGGSETFEYGLSVALDPVDNVFVTGQFQGTATFGNTNLVSRGGFDIFLAKHDGNGTPLWVTQAGGAAADIARTVALDGAGNSYIAGWIAGNATFGAGTTLTNLGSTDAFAAKYDSQGRLRWLAFVASNLGELGYGLALDAATNGYWLVWLENGNGSQLGLYKLDPAGNSQWSRQAGVNSDTTARGGVAVDAAGNSYITSQFKGTGTFGARSFLSQGTSDAFAAKYDTAGALLWVEQFLGTSAEEGRAISVDPAGSAYLAGSFAGTMTFGTLNLTSSGQGDVFVSRLDPPPRLIVTRLGDQVVLSWPNRATGFQLQSTASLPGGPQWETLPGIPVTSGNQNFVTNSIAEGNSFFRLRKP